MLPHTCYTKESQQKVYEFIGEMLLYQAVNYCHTQGSLETTHPLADIRIKYVHFSSLTLPLAEQIAELGMATFKVTLDNLHIYIYIYIYSSIFIFIYIKLKSHLSVCLDCPVNISAVSALIEMGLA